MDIETNDPFHGLPDSVLDRYLAGDTSSEETARVEAYFATASAEAMFVKGVRAAQGTGAGSFVPDPNRGKALVSERLGFTPRTVTRAMLGAKNAPSTNMVGESLMTRRSSAASGWRQHSRLFSFLSSGPIPQGVWYTAVGVILAFVLLSQKTRIFGSVPSGNGGEVYTTGNGEVKTVTLADGSMVTLNVASRLEVPHDYASGNRALRLRGQGLFSVVHQPDAPFTVQAGRTTTRVLGTVFSVRQYEIDTATIVAVRDGKVVVGSTVLTALQEIAVGRTGWAHVRDADTIQFSFAQGVLALDYRPLPDAVAELGRWYDAEIRLGDPVLSRLSIGGRFVAGSSATLADILEVSFDVRVERNGRILTLYPKR